jgi:hypothetical protein
MIHQQPNIIYSHSGGHGDICYSLAAVKRIGAGIFKTTFEDKYHRNIKPLLEAQAYIKECISINTPAIVTHNLDLFRVTDGIGKVPLILNHFRAFNVNEDNWNESWLTVPQKKFIKGKYALINCTPRYTAEGFDWDKEIAYLKQKYKQVFYVGYEADMLGSFQDLEYFRTDDSLELAQLIEGSEVLSCNQSFALTIAQGLGKPYRLMVADNHTNCIHRVPNETLLNYGN